MEFLTPEEIKWICEQAFEARRLIMYGKRNMTPIEFLHFVKDTNQAIKRSDLTTIDPYVLIDQGKKKLYELMSRQLLFECRIENYMKGKC